MRELWWLFVGTVRVRLTGADPEGTLRGLTQGCRLEQIVRISDLTVEFTASERDWKKIRSAALRKGDQVQLLARNGIPELLRRWKRYPAVVLTAALLVFATMWLPGRILFVRVIGNTTVPARWILEQAAQCGLAFGSSRADLRSEQVKNRLLDAVPELSWVGVNTTGCVATISLRERQTEPEEEQPAPGNIVAGADAVITDLTATAGTALCTPGEAVKAGQVLISGYTDLGFCTHVQAAQGEVYGLTRRGCSAVIPRITLVAEDKGDCVRKFSLLIGKKRINFDSDSGILYAGCGKMTKIRYLCLPGGWILPIALVEEVYTVSRLRQASRWEQSARETLERFSRDVTEQDMIAGQILESESLFDSGNGLYRLETLYQCREMIGRRSSGILTEGDTHDGKNRERGAG